MNCKWNTFDAIDATAISAVFDTVLDSFGYVSSNDSNSFRNNISNSLKSLQSSYKSHEYVNRMTIHIFHRFEWRYDLAKQIKKLLENGVWCCSTERQNLFNFFVFPATSENELACKHKITLYVSPNWCRTSDMVVCIGLVKFTCCGRWRQRYATQCALNICSDVII